MVSASKIPEESKAVTDKTRVSFGFSHQKPLPEDVGLTSKLNSPEAKEDSTTDLTAVQFELRCEEETSQCCWLKTKTLRFQ